jgi:hypothetical protein
MKKMAMITVALALLSLAPSLFAQEEHGEVGVFVDYTRLSQFGNTNFLGPGAQVGFNLGRFVQLEGGMAYNFERNVTVTTSTGGNSSFTRSRFRLLSGLFGPKIQTGVGPIKAFAVLKGGFLNFSNSNQTIGNGFTNAVNNVPNGNTNAVFYPGGGVEFFAKFIGLRAEVGDEMYFNHGTHSNLRVAVGPQFRF